MTDLRNLDKNMPILVVDDYSTVRRVVKNCLTKLGFKNVLEAEDFAGALTLISEHQVRLIISDWKLPDLGTDDTLARLKSDRKLNSLPLLLVVSEQQKNEILANSRATQEQLLVKPFTTETLQKKMEAVI